MTRVLTLAILLGVIALAAPGDRGAASAAAPAEAVPVAQAGGGTYPLPLYDAAQMAELQGLTVYPRPRVRLTTPRAGQVFRPGQPIQVRYRVENYEVGHPPDPGQHVHVILDDRPYYADYDPRGTAVFENVPDGTHTLVVFLARKFHLALKNPQAVQVVTFHVGEPQPENIPGPDTPMLIYSRPKDVYLMSDGSARNIMCDFYLLNCTLGVDGYKVLVYVNGQIKRTVTKWEPFILLTDPPAGEYTVRLELVDAGGRPVKSPLNSATRVIRVEQGTPPAGGVPH